MSEFEDWEPLAGGNNDASPDGWPEGMTRSGVNNSARENMAAIRRDWEGSAVGGGEWRNPIKGETLARISATQIRVVGVDATAFFPVGRKLKITHATGNPVYCFVTVSTFGTDTDITVSDFDDAAPDDEIRIDANGIHFYSGFGGGHGIRSGAFEDAGGSLFEVPQAFTSAGIQDAVDLAQVNGKIVLLATGTYVISSKIVITGSVQIWGRSWSKSFLQAQNTFNQDVIEISGGAASNVILRDFTINGNKANQAAGSGLKCTSDDMYGLLIDGVYFLNCYQRAIHLAPTSGSMRYVTIRDCILDTPGDSGIEVADPDGLSEYVNIDGCQIVNPGQGGAGVLSACGVRIDGKATIVNTTVRMDQTSGAHTGAGILLEQADSGASPSTGGNSCLVSNCRVTGSSAVARGIVIGGSANVVSGCSVALPSTGFPIVIAGLGAGVERASGNTVSDCRLVGGAKSYVATNSDKNVIQGCLITGANTVGIEVQSGATLTHITSNKFQSNTADVTDASANAVVDGNYPEVWSKMVQKTSGDVTATSTLTDVSGLTAITFPGLGANGVRKFKVTFQCLGSATSSPTSLTLYMGPNGTIADTALDSTSISPSVGKLVIGPIEVVPAAGDKIGVGIFCADSAGSIYSNTTQKATLMIEKVAGT